MSWPVIDQLAPVPALLLLRCNRCEIDRRRSFLVWPVGPPLHSCPLLQSCLPDSSSRTPSPHSRAVPCLVLSVQFSACLVTSPTFVLFVLSFCQPIKETKNRLIAILVWRRTYQEAEDHRTKKPLRKVQSLQAPQNKPPCRFCIVPS